MGQIEQKLTDKSVEIESLEDDINGIDGPTIEDVRLSIDAISLNVDLPAAMKAKIEQFAHEVSVDGTAKYKTSFHRFSDRFYGTSVRAYLNDLLAWEPTGASAFVCQTGSKRPGSKNTRFAWNPSKCDSVAIAGIIFNDYLGIPASCLIESTVSYIHLAADIPNARVDDQAISYPKMRSVQNKFSGGRTMYLGVKSGKTRIVAYDKRAEIKESNGKLGMYLDEIKEQVPPHDLLRIEIQLKPVSQFDVDLPMGILELSELSNAFSKLRVHAVPTTLSREERLALIVARHEGLARAVHVAKFDSAEKKAFYRELKKAGASAWWKPNEIWEQKFPPLIDEFLKPFMPLDTPLPGNGFDPPPIPKIANELTLS